MAYSPHTIALNHGGAEAFGSDENPRQKGRPRPKTFERAVHCARRKSHADDHVLCNVDWMRHGKISGVCFRAENHGCRKCFAKPALTVRGGGIFLQVELYTHNDVMTKITQQLTKASQRIWGCFGFRANKVAGSLVPRTFQACCALRRNSAMLCLDELTFNARPLELPCNSGAHGLQFLADTEVPE